MRDYHSHSSRLSRLIVSSILLSPFCFAVSSASNDSGPGPLPKKLIAAGWDSPEPQNLLDHLKAMEATPFNGVCIQVKVKDAQGGDVDFRRSFNAAPWKREWFKKEIDTLKMAKSEKLTDNFLLLGPGPSLDWFDDAGWKQAADHFRIAAWLAKQSGLKGIMFDPELGVSRQPAFHYKDQVDRQKRPFPEYAAKVRQRGREVMEAMAAEYPDMTFFTLFLHAGLALGALGDDPREGIEAKGYSLYPAFINGWLDVLPPKMTLVDGTENSYPHSTELQYLKRANATRNLALALVAPENWTKYRSQVQMSIALYMDAFVNFPKSNVHADVITDPPLRGGTVAERLQDATMLAREASDEYVWLWSEQYRWWPTEMPLVKPQSWDDILPGASRALRNGMDSKQATLARAEKEFAIMERKFALREVPMHNLIRNGDFNNGALKTRRPAMKPDGEKEGRLVVKEPPAEWTVLQSDQSGGRLEADVTGSAGWGSIRIAGAKEAAYAQTLEVSPYSLYKFRVKTRQMGAGAPEVRFRWVNAAGDPLQGESDRSPHFPEASPKQGWAEVSSIVKAPADAARLVVELGARDQGSTNDMVWYDDAELYRIDVN